MPTRVSTPPDLGWRKPIKGQGLNRIHPLAKGLVGAWLFQGDSDDRISDWVSGLTATNVARQAAFGLNGASPRGQPYNLVGLAGGGTRLETQVAGALADLHQTTTGMTVVMWLQPAATQPNTNTDPIIKATDDAPTNGWIAQFDTLSAVN